jgi:hypothetical protein
MENNLYKWIVYCTINTSNKKIYIGVHKTYTPDVFDGYLGNGVWAKSPTSYESATTAFKAAVKKYGPKSFIRVTINSFNNEKDAYELESKIVTAEFVAKSNNYNMILGGGAASITSIKTYQFDKTGKLIREFNSQVEAAKFHKVNPKSINRAVADGSRVRGFYFSENISADFTEKEKPDTVFEYDKKGVYLRGFKTIADAERFHKASSGMINKKIKEGTIYRNKSYFSKIKADKYDKAKSKQIDTFTIYQYAESGEFIAEYKNQQEARRALNIKTNLYNAIRLGNTAGGYQWRFEKFDKLDPVKIDKRKKIGKFKNGELIKIYNSKTEAMNENGKGLNHVLTGRDKTHKGYEYKYLID